MKTNKKRPPGTARRPRKPPVPKVPGPKGIVCPSCGVPLDVLDTRARARNVIDRRRACPICNHRVTTTERPKVA